MEQEASELWQEERWEDLRFHFRFRTAHGGSLDLELYALVPIDGELVYEAVTPGAHTKDIDMAIRPVVAGHIKFDECANLLLAGGGFLHTCSKSEASSLFRAIERAYDKAAEVFGWAWP